jgi:xanthine dehydrogenase YagS FAD-binding subunit
MKNFTYHQPATVAMALPLLDAEWGKTELLAGGTDLLDRQKEYVSQPDKLVSLTGIDGPFREIRSVAGAAGGPPQVTIGAGVKLVAIAESSLLGAYPAFAGAAAVIAGPQIRNMATLGGNLCQRNRCWYFRDEHVKCLLKGGKTCYAREGENEFHAIFTRDHPCVIVHPSTLAPPLVALGATAEIAGPKGTRTVALEKLYQAPEKDGQREHTLAPNEVLLSVTIAPKAPAGTILRNASYEVKQRETCEWPLVQASVAFQLQGKTAKGVRVVLGHVAPTPLLSESAAKALEGKEITEATASAAGEAAAAGALPLTGNAYKVQLLKVAVKRAALLAAGFKPYWES